MIPTHGSRVAVGAVLPALLLLACADPPPVSEFQVQLVAEGTGTVAGGAGALDCTLPAHSGTCHFEMESTTEGLTITATPAEGFLFTGWRPLGVHAPAGAVAACAGSTEPVCTLPTGAAAVMIRPRFEYPGVVEVAIAGTGTVRSATHACGEDSGDQERCRRSFPLGTVVTLKAIGDGFGGWDAPCYDGGTTCPVTADSVVTMTAYFQQDPPVTTRILRVEAAGGGSGRVRSSDDDGATVDCTVAGATGVGRCAVRVPFGSVIPLTVIHDSGSIPYAIAPTDCLDGICTLIMDQDRTLIARFEPPTQSFALSGAIGTGGVGFGGGVTFTSDPAGVRCEIRVEGPFDCGATEFPFGTELLVRVVFGPGTSFANRDLAWGSCPDGIGSCRSFLLHNPWQLEAALGPKQQRLRIVREDTLVVGSTLVRADGWIDRSWDLRLATKQFSIDLYADSGSAVTMSYGGSPGVALEGWSGACTGAGDCQFVLTGDAEVRFRVVTIPTTVTGPSRSPATAD